MLLFFRCVWQYLYRKSPRTAYAADNEGALFVCLLLGFFLVGCEYPYPEPFACNPPYIQKGNDCCLDQNENRICDNDEASVPETVPAETMEAVPEPVEAPTEVVPREPEPVVQEATTEEPSSQTPPTRQELDKRNPDEIVQTSLEKMKWFVKSYSYEHRIGKFKVKDNLVKIELDTPERFGRLWLDTYLIDRNKQTVQGTCNGMTEEHLCTDERLKAYSIDYASFRQAYGETLKLPEEWLYDLRNVVPVRVVSKGMTVNNRVTDVAEFPRGSGSTTLFIDNQYGIPIRIDFRSASGAENRIEYVHFFVNNVKDEEMRLISEWR